MPQYSDTPADDGGSSPQADSHDLTIPPVHGRAGRGWASILPHLARMKQTQIATPFRESDFEQPVEPWSVLGPLADSGARRRG